MTREQKIKKIIGKYAWDGSPNDENFKRLLREGILAGIRLRDEELLAMEFDIHKYNNYCLKFFNQSTNENWPTRLESAMWQHEQFIKAIKGE